jgi:arylsulfatase A-like enzyme
MTVIEQPNSQNLHEATFQKLRLLLVEGKIAPGSVSNATVSSLDFLPTILALAGVPLPSDRTYDGVDLAPLLFEGAPKVRDFLFMPDTTSRAGNVTAIHYLHWKAYSLTYSQDSCTERAAKPVAHQDYLIFDLDADPGETTPVRPGPAVVQAIRAAHAAILHDIATTFRSVADYSSGTMVADAPCCNATNALCRCQAQ